MTAFRALLSRDEYFNHRSGDSWHRKSADLVKSLPPEVDALPLESRLKSAIVELQQFFDRWQQLADERNQAFVLRKKLEHARWFESAAGKNPLSDEQQEAILHDEDNCLVVAGAGTGKTSLVVGKCRYLVHSGRALPSQILALAFTRKAAEEMRERLQEMPDLKATTFHAFGLEIVSDAEGKRPTVSVLAEDRLKLDLAIGGYLDALLEAPASRDALIEFIARFRYPYQSAFDFESPDRYIRTVRGHGLRSLQGEAVKSFEEAFIADWFFLNGIRYEYERKYEFDTASVQYRQYKPDFYLPDFGVYLEHFGIGRGEETAPGINAQQYKAQMEWKRALHKQHGTTLLETYSWQRLEGQLAGVLEAHLLALGARIKPRSPEETAQLIREQGFIRPVAKLLATFLSLYKSNAWSSSEIVARLQSVGRTQDNDRVASFLRVFSLVFECYQKELLSAGEVDFNDMITTAAQYVESGRFHAPFTHIIVDECQDFSRGRAHLLRTLIEQGHERRLFCVGDDWQSIFRFSGSDVAQMTHFEDEFGYTKRCELTVTHRFPLESLEASSAFIQENPEQLRKRLTATDSSGQPTIVLHSIAADEDTMAAVREVMAEIAEASPTCSVLVLARYNHALPGMAERAFLRRRHPGIDFRWLTVHRAKGLEADFTLILEVSSAKYGFPAQIADDPILDLVLAAPGGFPNAEERRLFYTGLTRARNRTYLLVPEASPSLFVDELSAEKYCRWVDTGGRAVNEARRCPDCRGVLLARTGPHGSFWGCANFPFCEVTARVCPRCKAGALLPVQADFECSCGFRQPRCPECGIGSLVLRDGRNGRFWGCTEWRPIGNDASCTYTRSST